MDKLLKLIQGKLNSVNSSIQIIKRYQLLKLNWESGERNLIYGVENCMEWESIERNDWKEDTFQSQV